VPAGVPAATLARARQRTAEREAAQAADRAETAALADAPCMAPLHACVASSSPPYPRAAASILRFVNATLCVPRGHRRAEDGRWMQLFAVDRVQFAARRARERRAAHRAARIEWERNNSSVERAFLEGRRGHGVLWTELRSDVVHFSDAHAVEEIAPGSVVTLMPERAVTGAADSSDSAAGSEESESSVDEDEAAAAAAALPRRIVVERLDRSRFRLDRPVDWSPTDRADWYWEANPYHVTCDDDGDVAHLERMGSGRAYRYTLPRPALWTAGVRAYEYEGERMLTGEAHGHGRVAFADGTVYGGQFRSGERHGQGRQTDTSGGCYTGQWAHDAPHGRGMYQWAGGAQYTGTWRHGRRAAGEGEFFWPETSKARAARSEGAGGEGGEGEEEEEQGEKKRERESLRPRGPATEEENAEWRFQLELDDEGRVVHDLPSAHARVPRRLFPSAGAAGEKHQEEEEKEKEVGGGGAKQ